MNLALTSPALGWLASLRFTMRAPKPCAQLDERTLRDIGLQHADGATLEALGIHRKPGCAVPIGALHLGRPWSL